MLDQETPADLIPANNQYPTERVQYEVLLFDAFEGEQRGNQVSLGNVGPLDISQLLSNEEGYQRPATGGVLTFTQSWYTKGLALGNLIHGVALAPGESTKIAMIDWSRRTRTSVTEGIQENELLNSDITRSRAINEITSAVAHETQSGNSGAINLAKATQSGESTGSASFRDLSLNPFNPLLPGVNTSGTSSGTSTGFTFGTSWSTSSGDRNVGASLSQDIVDRTQQASHSARNRRASIVREVSQQESESISTRTLTNYNHMHALTVEYYEVVQLYRTVVELSKADRCLFVPMKVINFENRAVVNRFQRIIAAAGLNPEVKALGILEPDHVAVVAPNRVKPWDLRSLKELSTATSEFVGTQESTAITLPKRIPAPIRFVFTVGFWEDAPIDQAVVTLKSGELYTFALEDVAETNNSWNPRFQIARVFFDREKKGHNFSELARIEFIKRSGSESYEGELTFGLAFNGDLVTLEDAIGATLRSTIKVPKETTQFTVFEFTESIGNDDFKRHLKDNALYYSQAIWRALDPATIGILLSGYTWPVGGQAKPLVELVDPTPVAIVANYLVFRMSGDDAKDDWLKKKKITVGSRQEDLVPVPSGGVFAEAVLGRFNSAEKLDITRFWNWQDSPIPIQAPDIAPIQSGSRGEPDNTVPGQLSAPVLNIVNPPALPDPQGMGAILAAIQNGNMFRDMSGLAATIGLAQAGLAGAQQGATDAAAQAGQNAAVAAQLGAKVAELAAKVVAAYFTRGASLAGDAGGGLAGLAGGISGQGAKINQGRDMDKRGAPSQISNGTSNGSSEGTEGSGSGGSNLGGGTGDRTAVGNESAAFNASLGGRSGGVLGQLLNTTLGMAAPSPAAPSLGSAPASALASVAAFGAAAGTTAWKLSRVNVAARLTDLINDPDLVDQDSLNLCGPASFFRLWIQRDPLAFARFAEDLYERGSSRIGTYQVKPGSDLLNQDYAAIKARVVAGGSHFAPEADWMVMSALRDSENSFFDYEGTPEEDVSAVTGPGTVAEWLKVTGLYLTIRNEGNFFFTKGLVHAMSLLPTANRDIILLINASMLPATGSYNFIAQQFPDHYIVLTSPIVVTTGGDVQFDYWSWAARGTLTVSRVTFEANYYGAVISER